MMNGDDGSGTRAWVLHRYPYRESSYVLELFTARQGRLGAVARGGRRPRSPFATLEAGRPLWVDWRGRGELVTLTRAEEQPALVRPLPPLASMSLFYLNELVLRLLPRWDAHPETFAVYEATVQSLPLEPEPAWLLRRFERRLLEGAGLAPSLERCRWCDARPEGRETWHYWPEHGAICARHAPPAGTIAVPAGVLQWLAGGLDAAPPAPFLSSLRRCLQGEIQRHVGDRPLESRKLLAAYLERKRRSAHAATTEGGKDG